MNPIIIIDANGISALNEMLSFIDDTYGEDEKLNSEAMTEFVGAIRFLILTNKYECVAKEATEERDAK